PLTQGRGPSGLDTGSSNATHPWRLRLAAVAGLMLLGAGGWFGQYWWTTGRYIVSTDDPYAGARSSTLSPEGHGSSAEIAVEDNAHLKAGDVIVRIDDGDYRLAVQTARDQVAVQHATIDRLGRQIVSQQAAVDQAKAQLASGRAVATRTDL